MTLFVAVASCGRPATERECEEIVERIAHLELAEANVSPAEAEEQVAETKQAFQSQAMDQCVGKRITEDALRCVRDAKTAKEIVTDCFN